MVKRRAPIAAAVLVAWNAAAQEPAPAQDPTQETPVFEVAVDLVAVDVSVVDEQGRPVQGLAPEDFEIEVDGRPRVVASIEYLGRDLEPPRAVAPKPAHYTSNEGEASGRLVLLLVDRGNIGRGAGRPAMAAADRFLETLAPSDRVGLTVMPGSGPNLEFTLNHARVAEALTRVVGQGQRVGFQVPLSEAVALVQNNDRSRWQRYVDLQCGHFLNAAEREECIQHAEAEAQEVYFNYRDRSQQSKRALENVFLSLRDVPGPKTVVLISEGLTTDSPSETRRLAEAAAEAQVTLFVLLLERSGVDAAFRKERLSTLEERDLETSALYDLAGLARGAVLRVSGSADPPFQRITRELMGYYMIGFEPIAGDRDGKSHEVRVKVKREKVSVRSRGVLRIPTAAPQPRELIVAALRSPLVERGLPVRVATYARPAHGGKVRLLLVAEIARASSPVSVGYVLVEPGGEVAASRLLEGLTADAGEPLRFVGEATLDPGRYTLRLAAMDAAGRKGSVHHATTAAVVSAGGLLISDLILAPPGDAALHPVVDLETDGSGLLALVELAGGGGAASGASVAIELAEREDGAALLQLPAEAGPADRNGVRTARVSVAGGLLPPGQYVARAIVSAAGKPVAAVTRPFHVATPRAGAAARRAPLAAVLAETRAFDRGELLEPERLGYFIDRVSELVPGPLPEGMAAAVEDARAGRPAAMLARLGSAGKEDARVFFLRGVSYYASGNFNAALAQLQEAMRARSELFPAAVYMGACYAAGGKDLDAIGAWQTALIGESGSATLYAVLADALLRVDESEQAVSILDEGLQAFPEDENLRRRLALAHAMAGHSEDALVLLTAWVDAHPQDTRALFATLALLFDGFSREAAGGANVEEQQRLRRYAKAYIASEGPNREVVERWLRYLDSRGGG